MRFVDLSYQSKNNQTEFRLHSLPKRRVASSISKTSTGNIESVFTAQDKLLKDEIDVLMSLFQVSQPDFYNAYKNARAIVNYVGRGKGAPAEEPVAIH